MIDEDENQLYKIPMAKLILIVSLSDSSSRSKWFTLAHLDIIKARNKPKPIEPSKTLNQLHSLIQVFTIQQLII